MKRQNAVQFLIFGFCWWGVVILRARRVAAPPPPSSIFPFLNVYPRRSLRQRSRRGCTFKKGKIEEGGLGFLPQNAFEFQRNIYVQLARGMAGMEGACHLGRL